MAKDKPENTQPEPGKSGVDPRVTYLIPSDAKEAAIARAQLLRDGVPAQQILSELVIMTLRRDDVVQVLRRVPDPTCIRTEGKRIGRHDSEAWPMSLSKPLPASECWGTDERGRDVIDPLLFMRKLGPKIVPATIKADREDGIGYVMRVIYA